MIRWLVNPVSMEMGEGERRVSRRQVEFFFGFPSSNSKPTVGCYYANALFP